MACTTSNVAKMIQIYAKNVHPSALTVLTAKLINKAAKINLKIILPTKAPLATRTPPTYLIDSLLDSNVTDLAIKFKH